MRVLITGANGFLGYYLVQQLLEKGHEVLATGKGLNRLPFDNAPGFRFVSMDFTDAFNVHDVFEAHQPQAVVHAGAMSKPDDCELNQALAYQVNTEATITLLLNAAERKSHFIFISTDFIFDGKSGSYGEDDPGGPVNYYGRTKLEAEEAVQEYEYPWTIVRTSLVYGKPSGIKGNILAVIKEKLEKGEGYGVFNDQFRSPTYVEDLATGIVAIIERKATGVYHLSGKDILTPYAMGVKTAELLGFDSSLVRPIAEGQLIQPACRPARTNLLIEKAKQQLAFSPVSFEEGLKKTFS